MNAPLCVMTTGFDIDVVSLSIEGYLSPVLSAQTAFYFDLNDYKMYTYLWPSIGQNPLMFIISRLRQTLLIENSVYIANKYYVTTGSLTLRSEETHHNKNACNQAMEVHRSMHSPQVGSKGG